MSCLGSAMQSFLLMKLKEKILGLEKPCLFLFIKVRQLAAKFLLPSLPVRVIKLKKRGRRTAPFKTKMSILEGDALHGCAGNKLTGMGKSQQHGDLMQLIC